MTDQKPTSRAVGEAASANITERIRELGDWRGETLTHVRRLIHDADPDIQEEWKWKGNRRGGQFRSPRATSSQEEVSPALAGH